MVTPIPKPRKRLHKPEKESYKKSSTGRSEEIASQKNQKTNLFYQQNIVRTLTLLRRIEEKEQRHMNVILTLLLK
jgi:hypothetical protein